MRIACANGVRASCFYATNAECTHANTKALAAVQSSRDRAVAPSRRGADADVAREFDLADKQWVKDGFFRTVLGSEKMRQPTSAVTAAPDEPSQLQGGVLGVQGNVYHFYISMLRALGHAYPSV